MTIYPSKNSRYEIFIEVREPGQRPIVYRWDELSPEQKRWAKLFAIDPYGILPRIV